MKAKTDTIQIRPGVFIEVSQRLRKQAGVGNRRLAGRVLSKERQRAIFGDVARDRRGNVKYSRLLLDEAVAVSRQRGVKAAAKLTGVKYWSIVQRKRELARTGKFKPRAKPNSFHRYTSEQKQRCVMLAKQLKAKGWDQRPAFIEAGKRLKMNGRSVEWMWMQSGQP